MVKVSVIIPTYNRFKYLLNAIESVVNQTHKDIEVIVVNDCSTEEEYYSFDFNSSLTTSNYLKSIFNQIVWSRDKNYIFFRFIIFESK